MFRLEAETLALFATEKREISSVNNLISVVRPRGRSLSKTNRPKTEHCGTPAGTDFQTEDDCWEQLVDMMICLKAIQ